MTGGVMGEFASGHAMLEAIRGLRDRGWRDLDAYSPYPVEGAEEALGLARSRIPFAVFAVAMAAAALAFWGQWYLNAEHYPLNVGGRPLFSWPAWIVITFELGILGAGLATFVALLVKAGLPSLWRPEFEATGFERASIDRFFVAIDAADPAFDAERAARDLRALGAARVAVVGDDEALARGVARAGASAAEEGRIR